MADLYNTGAINRVKDYAQVTAAQAIDIDVSSYDNFVFRSPGSSTGAPALTWLGVVPGRVYSVHFYFELTDTTDFLKPTNSASTNSAGTTLVFHSNGTLHSGAGNAAWPTLDTTAGLWNYANWRSPDGVNFFLATFVLALDE